MFDALSGLTTPAGLTLTGFVAALSIVLWDWRASLAAAFFVQVAVAAVAVNLLSAPPQWALIQIAVMALACTILGLSAVQSMRHSLSAQQAGSYPLRLMAIVFFTGAWELLGIRPDFLGFGPDVSSAFVWLAVCAALTLGLGVNPFFTAIGLMLWFAPVQAMTAALLGIPALVAMIGILQLLVALACSYLMLAEQAPQALAPATLTDIAFPQGRDLDMGRERTPATERRARLPRLPRRAPVRSETAPAPDAMPPSGAPSTRTKTP